MLPQIQPLCQPLVSIHLERLFGLDLGVLEIVVKVGLVSEKVVEVLMERVEKEEEILELRRWLVLPTMAYTG